MRLSISHETTYRYEDQVRASIQYPVSYTHSEPTRPSR